MSGSIRYLETLCSECVLRVVAGDTFTDETFPPFPYVAVQLLSTHAGAEHNSVRGKLARVRAALRDEPLPSIEFTGPDELQRFVDALAAAADAAFGRPAPNIPQGT